MGTESMRRGSLPCVSSDLNVDSNSPILTRYVNSRFARTCPISLSTMSLPKTDARQYSSAINSSTRFLGRRKTNLSARGKFRRRLVFTVTARESNVGALGDTWTNRLAFVFIENALNQTVLLPMCNRKWNVEHTAFESSFDISRHVAKVFRCGVLRDEL